MQTYFYFLNTGSHGDLFLHYIAVHGATVFGSLLSTVFMLALWFSIQYFIEICGDCLECCTNRRSRIRSIDTFSHWDNVHFYNVNVCFVNVPLTLITFIYWFEWTTLWNVWKRDKKGKKDEEVERAIGKGREK